MPAAAASEKEVWLRKVFLYLASVLFFQETESVFNFVQQVQLETDIEGTVDDDTDATIYKVQNLDFRADSFCLW